ncbi:chitinase [Williamsoniiplasma luminosum]|uniref:Chitinase n=1 Tax=Williamsoniiplasma luminosum TaxID=214888 RepID=A0A2K8NVG0_9MOLU|nr:hypothetical protein [Williamsoniiplasma luminosum]ATZ16731.1 chitinase [Williamsoniiplasma luminosum]
MKKILMLLGNFTICATLPVTVVACGVKMPNNQIDIEQIPNIQLNLIDLDNLKSDTIIAKFLEENQINEGLKTLKARDLEAEILEDGRQKIVVQKGTKHFKGSVIAVCATKKNIIELEGLSQEIGSLNNNNAATIKTAFLAKNQLLKMQPNDLEVIETTGLTAKIRVKPNARTYQGEILVNFVLKTNIKTVLIKTLNGLNDENIETIKTAFLVANPSLNLHPEDLEIQIKDGGKATITILPSSITYHDQVDVFYTIKNMIRSANTIFDLGPLIDAEIDTIKTAFLIKNPSLNLRSEDLEIQIKDVGKATITILPSSLIHQGKVEVIYTIKTNNAQWNGVLGPLDNNFETTIKRAFLIENPSLNLGQEDLEVSETSSQSAKIKIKSNVATHQGEVIVSFTIKTNINIATSKALGGLNNKEQDTIKNNFIDKNQNLDLKSEDLEVIAITDLGATISVLSSSSTHQGSVNVSFSLKANIDTANTVLGMLNDNNEATIKNNFIAKNQDLDLKSVDLEVNDIQNNGATIRVKNTSSTHQGSVNVSFSLKTNIDTANTVLGMLNDNNEATIKTKFIEKNPTLGLGANQLEVSATSSQSAKIKSNVATHQGEVVVNFSIKPDIDTTNTITHLGAINDNSSDMIKNIFLQMNSQFTSLAKEDLELVGTPDNVKSRIRIKNTSLTHQGQVDVSYTIKPNINTGVLNLGPLNSQAESTIRSIFLEKNSFVGLTGEHLEISAINTEGATIKVKTNAPTHQGQVDVTYSIKPTINAPTLNLGALNNNAEAIKEALIAQNPLVFAGLTINDLEFVGTPLEGSATIKIKDSFPTHQGQYDVTYTIKPSLVVTTTNLGALDNRDESTIKFLFLNKNSITTLTEDDLIVSHITNHEAKIKVRPDFATLQGSADVQFENNQLFLDGRMLERTIDNALESKTFATKDLAETAIQEALPVFWKDRLNIKIWCLAPLPGVIRTGYILELKASNSLFKVIPSTVDMVVSETHWFINGWYSSAA